MNENVSDRDMSEFNMALSYLNRLNNLFYEADKAAIELNAFGWYNVLLALYRELSTEMKEEEIEKWNKEIFIIGKAVQLNIKKMSNTREIKMTNQLYLQLHKFELFLRRVLKQSGLQMKMKEDPGKALN